MPEPAAPTFSPPEDAIDSLLADLARPDISFLDLASRHHTTPEALSLWMTRPGIRDRLAASADIITWRTQYVATFQLSTAVSVLSNICTTYSAESPAPPPARIPDYFSRLNQDAAPPTPSPPAPVPTPIPDLILKLRRAESARRAATTLIRLTTLRPLGPPTITTTRAATSASTRAPDVRAPASTPPTHAAHSIPVTTHAASAHPSNSELQARTSAPSGPSATPAPSSPARPTPPAHRTSNLLPRITLTPPRRPRSTSSLLDLVGASSSLITPPHFSPRDPFP